MYFDQAALRPYLEQGLITEQQHPLDKNIRIYNYTHKVQHDPSLWDDVTTHCRGLVLDVQREVVVNACLRKFWNYEEHIQHGWGFPNEKPVITTKYDGWYGSLLWFNDEPWIATRGSFTSPGAEWATQWFRHIYRAMPHDAQSYWRNLYVTHIFEIVSPVTRIVVQYDFEGLVHLATIVKETDDSLWPLHTPPGILSVPEIAADDYAALKDLNAGNEEGFVIFFPQAQMRMKIKFQNYVLLHKIITGLSVKGIWEHLTSGNPLESLLDNVPDEIYKWARGVCDSLTREYEEIESECGCVTEKALAHYATRKAQAMFIRTTSYPSVCFSMLDDKKYSHIIWKIIEPKGLQTFRTDS